jgi:hypothetical protein
MPICSKSNPDDNPGTVQNETPTGNSVAPADFRAWLAEELYTAHQAYRRERGPYWEGYGDAIGAVIDKFDAADKAVR